MENRYSRGAYALQLSDACLRNGLTDPAQVLRALKINLLFFDWMCVSAPALLRNHVLFDALSTPSKDQQALVEIYNRGLIRPVVFDEGQHLTNVARAVVNNKINGVGLSDPKRGADFSLVEKHAELIGKGKKEYLVIAKQPVLKRHFCDLLETVVTSGIETRIDKTHSEILLERLTHAPSDIRVVDINQMLDELEIPPTKQLPLRQAAFLAMEWAARPAGSQQFAATGAAAPIIDLLSGIGRNSNSSAEVNPTGDFVVSLSIDRIESLSLAEVLEARSHPLFQELRNFLHPYRKRSVYGSPIPLSGRDAKKFSELESDFTGWLCGKRRIDRKAYLERLRSRTVGLHLKQSVYLGAVIATGIALHSGESNAILSGLATAITAVLGSHALNYEVKTSTVSYERDDETMKINTVTGREKEPRME